LLEQDSPDLPAWHALESNADGICLSDWWALANLLLPPKAVLGGGGLHGRAGGGDAASAPSGARSMEARPMGG